MDKVLIAYSTWTGATHQVAEEIARDLENKNTQITLLPAKEVKFVNEFQSVLIGTPIHAGQTTRDFNHFLSRFHEELATKKTAYFVVCFNLIEDNESNRNQTISWLDKSTGKYPEIKPVSIGLFAGAALTESPEFKKQNFLVRKIVESMNKTMVTEKGKSDFRDSEKIHAWTEELAKKLA
jgi:menaquinone-dependent protoporphyrinogen IX oxidase